ncbi:unnamed protein product [Mortierella alpina]
MLIHTTNHRSKSWIQRAIALGLVLTALSHSHATTFRDSDFDQRPLHQAESNTAATILDILGERSEFSKLLELIQKDKDLAKLLADPGTQASLIGKSICSASSFARF